MSLAVEVAHGLDGTSHLRALMASGRKPGILISLNFDFFDVEEQGFWNFSNHKMP